MRLTIAALALLGLAAPALAQSFDDPRDTIAELYSSYVQGDIYVEPPLGALLSARLYGLFEADWADAEAAGGMGRIDFDPFVNGQDFDITDLVLDEPYYAGGRAVVHVEFRNFGEPQAMGYLLVDEDGWKIDNLWVTSHDYSYELLDILQQPLPQ